jgi:hypothetical protein
MSDEQPDMFEGARAARDEGLDRVEANNSAWMDHALVLIRENVFGEMTGEELRLTLRSLGLPAPAHHNAWGALVRTAICRKLLAKTGAYSQMRTTRSHARETPVLRKIA